MAKDNTWQCTSCSAINEGEFCCICGQARPAPENNAVCGCGYRNRTDARFCARCGRKLDKSRKKRKRIVVLAVVLAAAVLTAVLAAFFLMPKDLGPVYQSAQGNAAEDPWRENVLMKDRASEVIPLGGYKSSVMLNTVLGSDLIRGDVCRVVFEDSLRNVPDDCWDASESRDRSVLAWTVPAQDNLYELHIAAEGGINGSLACEDLFCGYSNVTEIVFNDCFHTEEAEDFSRMFYGCWQLKTLDLSGIRTDSATNLSEMFAGCHGLTTVDVSGFDTSKVEDVSGMFSNCWELQSVDITGLDLFRVRDVSYMFYQCPAAKGQQLTPDGFNFRNVDRYENFMDSDVLMNGRPWITFFEVADIPVKQQASGVKTGDIIVFGTYEQDNLSSNGAEPVGWLVLDVQGDSALLLSCYALDSRPYHNATAAVTWETSSLRKWLNSEFLFSAFTATERDLILTAEVDNGKAQGNKQWDTSGGSNTYDQIFLLSYAETEQYLPDQSSRVCSPTDYAVNMGADTRALDSEITDAGWWWLRSPGEKSNHAAFVNFDGTRYTNMVSNGYLSVRPAMWIDLSRAVLE